MSNFTDKIETERLQDSSLWTVYKNSDSYSENAFDTSIRFSSGIVLILLDLVIALRSDTFINDALTAILNWSNLSFTYSITILGFLVAGFTIFATMTKVEIFIALSAITHKTEDISQIKFIFYNFLRVFINHIILLFLSVFFSNGS